GIIRDVIAREIPLIMQKEVYATACIIGGTVHTLLLENAFSAYAASVAGIITTLAIRLVAIRWQLSLPIFTFEKAR
ncbi:MAG: TRIC cation channel family protein, partial [Enterovibrio sp.]